LAVAFMMDDSHIQAPLAQFMGKVPEPSAWFTWALAQVPQRSFVKVEGARIETLVWGEAGRSGVLLLHGHGAHADWYSFIAPFFADRHRVVALSWSGMGASDWRETYSVEQFGREALAITKATGLFDASVPPIIVGHSFGGRIAIDLAADYGEKFGAAIIVDPPVFAPANLKEMIPRRAPRQYHHIYPTLTEALAHFRLAPAQPCSNFYILDHIARLSLHKVPGTVGGEPGWSWRFDPALWLQLKHRNPMPFIRAARCPLALVRGSRSRLMRHDDAAHMMAALPEGAPYVEVPEADHHVMLDQPLAFVTAIEALLATRPATWPAQQEAVPT
jgi:pimeloyl-ACP methyl ester carboxylesterase